MGAETIYWYYFTALDYSNSTGGISTLIGKTAVECFRDGIKYRRTDSTPTGKRFGFDTTTGAVTFDSTLILEPGEKIDISYKLSADVIIIPDCVPVVIPDDTLPDGSMGASYLKIFSLAGTQPFIVSNEVHPGWMTVYPVKDKVSLVGTPDIEGTDIIISFRLTNCSGNTADYSSTMNVYAAGVPANTASPVVSGLLSVGSTLLVSDGSWTNSPSSYAYQWQSDATGPWIDIGGETTNSYVIQPGDDTHHLRVSVTATNVTGSGQVYSNEVTVSVTGTQFGALIGTNDSIDDKITVVKKLGLGIIRGAHTGLSNYTAGKGSGLYDKVSAAGIKMIHNLNWNASSAPTAQFASNETLYKAKFNLALDDFAADQSVVIMVVIENEPTNDAYYGDTMAHYIQQLGWAIEVCHARSPQILIADGCMHIELILGVKAGGSLNANETQADEIMTGINNLRIAGKVLDFVNMHTNLKLITPGEFAEAAQYLRDRTGIDSIMSNEWHIESNNTAVIQDGIDQSRAAPLFYSVIYGGDYPWITTNAYPLNNGITLTDMGIAARDEVALV